jgi:hypothetical protein
MTIGATVRTRVDHEDAEKAIVEILKWSELGTVISFAPGVGGSNTCIYTIQVVDAQGNNVAAVFNLAAYFSSSAVGANLTAAAFSGDLVAGASGAILTEFVAKKYFDLITDATGKFIGTLTDTAKTQGQYLVVPRPRGDMQVSGPTVTASYG